MGFPRLDDHNLGIFIHCSYARWGICYTIVELPFGNCCTSFARHTPCCATLEFLFECTIEGGGGAQCTHPVWGLGLKQARSARYCTDSDQGTDSRYRTQVQTRVRVQPHLTVSRLQTHTMVQTQIKAQTQVKVQTWVKVQTHVIVHTQISVSDAYPLQGADSSEGADPSQVTDPS